MKDKLNSVVNPTVKNVLFILLAFILPQIATVAVVVTNDHYKQQYIELELSKKADAQDLAEYIKLNKMRNDLNCDINNQAHDFIVEKIDAIQDQIDKLERRIFEKNAYRGIGKGDEYDLSNGMSLIMNAGVYPGDYCKPNDYVQN